MRSNLKSYWSNKAVLITGASSGLGWALAEALAPYNIHFCLLSRRLEKMQELADSLSESGSRLWMRACDVRDRQAVTAAVQDFHREAGRLDAAWVNSGVSYDSSFAHWSWEAAETMIDTNLKGALYTAQACLEIMVPQSSGTIVGMGSAASMRGLPNRGIYSLTKIGLHYYLESLAAELPQIQFTIIHPGFVDTPINQGNPNRIWLVQPDRAAQRMIKAVARGRRTFIYPLPMRILYTFMRNLPQGLYLWLARRAVGLSEPSEKQRMVNGE